MRNYIQNEFNQDLIVINENVHIQNARNSRRVNVNKYQNQATQITIQNHDNTDQTPLLAPQFDEMDPTCLDLSLSKIDPAIQLNNKGVSSANKDQRSVNLWAGESLKTASGV